ncbi:hypothetical protein BH23ACT5_BH23ACT5_05340 [soil metagenome]
MTEPAPPAVSRPQAPDGYGYSTEPEGMLTWSRVHEALAAATVYWIGTARPDASPHLHPIWGSFVSNRLFIEGGDTTRWARNIISDPRVSFGIDAGGLHVSGRGRAERGRAGTDFESLRANYGEKYDYRPESDQFWKVEPSIVIALDMSSLESFASSPSRFTFEE